MQKCEIREKHLRHGLSTDTAALTVPWLTKKVKVKVRVRVKRRRCFFWQWLSTKDPLFLKEEK